MTEETKERRGFRVRGRVQGVGFRWSAARYAQAIGLEGSIRNAADGSVEVSAQGPREALDRLAVWLSNGPKGAVVESVEDTAAELPILEGEFRILR